MQFSTLLVILASLATAQASAVLKPRACFDNDNPERWWWGKDQALKAVDRICTEAGVSGYFSPGQTKTHCEQGPPVGSADPKKTTLKFEVTWTGTENPKGALRDEDCRRDLKKEINGCQTGGVSTHYGWRYT
jgi:hypothetical protein